MGPTLFDDVTRTDGSPSRHAEGRSAFLNRVAGPVFDRVRTTLLQSFERFPTEGRVDLRARFRQGSNDSFSSAFWELYLHETLTRMGFEVALHPEIPGTTRRPDFLCARPGEHGFYLEATLASASRDERAADLRLGAIYDALNRIDTPDFFLDVTVEQQGPTPPPTGRLRRDVNAWLGGLDPDALLEEGDRYLVRHGHEYAWQQAGWRILLRPIPKSPAHRDKPGPAIGMLAEGTGARAVDTTGGLRRAIREKAGRYGQPDRPYVIAVLIEDAYTDEEDVVDALFGTVTVMVPVAPRHPGRALAVRQRDGSWTARGGPANTRVSAVLTAINLAPWALARTVPRLWINPWAVRPLTDRLAWRTTRVNVGSGTLDDEPALRTPADLLDLPADWPGPEEPFPDG